MDAVILHLSWRNLRYTQRAKERQQVNPQPNFVTLGPTLAAFAFGDDFVFRDELFSRLSKALFREQSPSAILAAQSKLPVFGKLGGKRETFSLRGSTPLLATN